MKKIVLIVFLITKSYFNYSQEIKSVELANTVNISKFDIDYGENNPNNSQEKGIGINPSLSITFLEYKYFHTGIIFEFREEKYKKDMPMLILDDNNNSSYYTYQSEFDYVSLGIKINPQYPINQGLSIYAIIDPYINYRVLTTNFILVGDGEPKIVPSLSYGIGTKIKIWQSLNLCVEVFNNYYLSDVLNNDMVKVRVNSWDVKLGLLYSIGENEMNDKK